MHADMHSVTSMHSRASRWADFVREHIGDDTQQQVAANCGIRQPTISRWLSGRELNPSAGTVVAFARAYGVPPVEALVAAGVISHDEVLA